VSESGAVLCDDIGDGVDDVLDVLVGHFGIDGQGDETLVFAVGYWEVFWGVAVGIAVVGVKVERDEVDAGADVARFQLDDELGPVDAEAGEVEAQHVEVPGVLVAGGRVGLGGDLQLRELRKGRRILILDRFPPFPHSIDFAELGQAHGRRNICHVVFEAGRDDLIEPVAFGGVALPGVTADAVEAHYAAALGPGVVVGADHAALAGGEGLGGVEGEAGKRRGIRGMKGIKGIGRRRGGGCLQCFCGCKGLALAGADEAAVVAGGQGVGGVFDDDEVVSARHGLDGVHVAGQAGQVHGHDGLGPGSGRPGASGRMAKQRRQATLGGGATLGQRCAGLGQAGRIEVEGHSVHIDKQRRSAEIAHHLGRGGEGERRGEHQVAGLQPERFQRQVHRRRARIHRDRMFGPHEGHKFRLKLMRLRPGGDPAGADGVGDLGDLGFVGVGQSEGKERWPGGQLANGLQDCQFGLRACGWRPNSASCGA